LVDGGWPMLDQQLERSVRVDSEVLRHLSELIASARGA
jgi:hypothetical protein